MSEQHEVGITITLQFIFSYHQLALILVEDCPHFLQKTSGARMTASYDLVITTWNKS